MRKRTRSKHSEKGFSGGKGRTFGAKLFLTAFGLIFSSAGLFFFWIGSLQPILKSLEARDWVEHPCVIENSYVKTHRGSDGNTYSVQIYFRYEWDGVSHLSKSYSFSDFASSGRRSKEEIVRQYPIGSQAVCFVNPENPGEAVIHREMDRFYFLVGGFTLLFVFVGFGVIIFAFFLGKSQAKHKLVSDTATYPIDIVPETVLQPMQKRGRAALLSIIFAIFWNAISLMPLYFYFYERQQGNTVWMLLIISIISLLVGIFLIFVAIYSLLALKNPYPQIQVRPGRITPGRTYELSWNLKGSISRLEDFRLILEGVEVARYRRGTNTMTDRNVFMQETILETTDRAKFGSGHISFTFPQWAVPTFKSANNQVLYCLICKGKIRRWPDLADTFVVEVSHIESTSP